MRTTVQEAAELLLSYDTDRAQIQNGVGYRKGDGIYVDKLLSGPLTSTQEKELKKRLKIYKGQLAANNIIWEDLVLVVDPKRDEEIERKRKVSARIKKVSAKDNFFTIELSYNPFLIGLIKSTFNQAIFDWESKLWKLPITKSNKGLIKAFANKYEFKIDIKFDLVKIEEDFIGRIYRSKKSFIVEFPYNKRIIDALREIPGRQYVGAKKHWKIPFNSFESKKALIELSTAFHWKLECRDEIDSMKKEIFDTSEKLEKNKEGSDAMDSDYIVDGLKGELFPFQRAGVEYIARNKKVLLGDEMGLGKTITTIASIHHLKVIPAYITVPNTLKVNWKREIEKWTDYKVVILESAHNIDTFLKQKFDIVIANYHATAKYHAQLAKYGFKAVIGDESHSFKNKATKRTKGFKALAKQAEVVLELTGTAIVNRPSEIISQLEILGVLGEFGGTWGFMNRYCGATKGTFGTDYSGSSNLIELHEKLRAHCYIRREGVDVIKELPELTRSMIPLPISNRAEYNRAERDLINYLKTEIFFTIEQVEGWYIKRYRERIKENKRLEEIEAILLPDMIDWDDLSEDQKYEESRLYRIKVVQAAQAAEHLVRINALKKLTAKGKMKAVIEWISDFLESGEKLVLFAHHVEFIKNIAEHFKCDYIIGEIGIEERQRRVDRFQEDPSSKLLILNLAVGGVGITLTASSNLAFLELGWTPGELDQAEKRIHRIGQKAHSNIWYLLGYETIDEDIYELIEEKRVVTAAVNKGVVEDREVKIFSELINRLKGKSDD